MSRKNFWKVPWKSLKISPAELLHFWRNIKYNSESNTGRTPRTPLREIRENCASSLERKSRKTGGTNPYCWNSARKFKRAPWKFPTATSSEHPRETLWGRNFGWFSSYNFIKNTWRNYGRNLRKTPARILKKLGEKFKKVPRRISESNHETFLENPRKSLRKKTDESGINFLSQNYFLPIWKLE